MREESFCFGPARNLPGTLTIPDGGNERRVGLVLFNSGVIHRVGPHRLNVRIARALSRAGFASLRFDLSSVGDGSPAPRARTFEAQAIDDLRLAIDAVCERTGVGAVAIYGICSGAVQAFEAARVDRRVAGLFLQDGFAFPTAKTHVRRFTLPLLTEPSRVLRAIVRRLHRSPTGDAPDAPRAVGSGADAPPAGSAGWTPAEFALALDELAARGTRVRLLSTGSILDLYNYPGQFAERVPVRSDPSIVRCDFAPDIDHTVSNAHARRALLGRIEAWIEEVDAAVPAPATAEASVA
jgi:hypothetical protein